jgi:hypothetical protein
MPRNVELSSIELTAICQALYFDSRDLQLAAGSLPNGHKDKPFFKRTGDKAIALLSRIQVEFSDKAGETVVLILQVKVRRRLTIHRGYQQTRALAEGRRGR